MTVNSSTIASQFAEVREALFRWEDHDKPNYEFFVRNKIMVNRPNNQALCAIIEHKTSPDDGKLKGFALVRESWANMFPAHHVSCAIIPPDGNWTADHHERNAKRFLKYIKEAYEEGSDEADERARYMIAIRRQIVMYAQIFPDSGIDTRPTQYEAVIVVDAKMQNEGGQYLDAMAQFLERERDRGINEI